MLPSVLVSRDTEQSWMLNMVFCLNRKVLKLPTSNLFLLALIGKVSKLSKTSFGARVGKVRKTLASICSLSALVFDPLHLAGRRHGSDQSHHRCDRCLEDHDAGTTRFPERRPMAHVAQMGTRLMDSLEKNMNLV